MGSQKLVVVLTAKKAKLRFVHTKHTPSSIWIFLDWTLRQDLFSSYTWKELNRMQLKLMHSMLGYHVDIDVASEAQKQKKMKKTPSVWMGWTKHLITSIIWKHWRQSVTKHTKRTKNQCKPISQQQKWFMQKHSAKHQTVSSELYQIVMKSS